MGRTSPCMCGDPYCGSCGDPSAAMIADKIDDACDAIYNLCETADEIDIFVAVGSMAVHAFKEANARVVNDLKAEDAEYYSWMKDRQELLEKRLKRLGGDTGDYKFGEFGEFDDQ